MPSFIKKSRVNEQSPGISCRKRAHSREEEVSSSPSKKSKNSVVEESQGLLALREEHSMKVDSRLKKFVKYFISSLVEKLQSYHDRLSKNVGKPGKFSGTLAQSANIVTMAGVVPGVNVALATIVSALPSACGSHYNRKQVKKLLPYLYQEQKALLEILVESGCKIFQSFENQFVRLISDQSWERAMEKLANEGVDRIIDYLKDNSEEEFSTRLVISGFILGKSKRGRNHIGFSKLHRGHALEFNGSNVEIQDLIGNAGLTVIDSKNDRCYYAMEGSDEKYGFRCFFEWEKGNNLLPGILAINGKTYRRVNGPTENLHFLLTDEVLEEKQKEILEMLKEQKDYIKETAENVKEILVKIDNFVDYAEKEQEREPTWFCVTRPVKIFARRGNKLEELHNELYGGKQKNTEILQMVSVTGLKGTGKSELARHYAYEKRSYYDNNVIWINAETQESLEESFKELAEKLQITIKENRGKIKSIVEDVYKYFKSTKSLFIFDNAKEYESIKRFLPSSLPPDYEVPYFLITSNTEKWKAGDEGKIEIIRLDGFEKEEAVDFVKKALDIKGNAQDRDIETLAEELKYFPLALKRATQVVCEENERSMKINQGEVTVAKYLEDFKQDKKMDLFKFEPDKSSGDRYGESILTAWEKTCKYVKQNGSMGERALEILERVCHFHDKYNNVGVIAQYFELLEQHSIVYIKDGKVSVRGLVGEIIKEEKRSESQLPKALDKLGNNPKTHLSSIRVNQSDEDKIRSHSYR